MALLEDESGERMSVKEYMTETSAVSRPTAIFLTIVFILICIALLGALFFGGRWVYRTSISDNDDKNQNTSSNQPAVNPTTAVSGGSTTVSPAPTQNPTSTPTPTSTPSPSTVPNTGPEPE
jgi:hypothetical protein